MLSKEDSQPVSHVTPKFVSRLRQRACNVNVLVMDVQRYHHRPDP